MRALVVDVDEDVLVFAAEALNSFAPGFDVATARDLEEAVLWLDVFPPDIVLVDPTLCGGRLETLSKKVRADYRSRHCKIVAVSAEPAWDGVDAVLSKPLQLEPLLDTVRLLVGPPSAPLLAGQGRLRRNPSSVL
jgi:DNA-binding response OmpR family regulator